MMGFFYAKRKEPIMSYIVVAAFIGIIVGVQFLTRNSSSLFGRSPSPHARRGAYQTANYAGYHQRPARSGVRGCLTKLALLLLLALVIVLAYPFLVERFPTFPHFPFGSTSYGQSTGSTVAMTLTADYVSRDPTISAAMIEHILVDNGSPAIGLGQTMYNLGVQYHIDPAYALAFFHHESNYGRKGVAVETHALGNIRCTAGYACDRLGAYRAYPNWTAGFEDWFKLIHDVYLPRGYTTIRTIVPVYAPSSENDVPAYIDAVQRDVTVWRSGKEG
jgi:hypothetical protein